MLRISRLTDYATVLLAALASEPDRVQTAAALAEQQPIPPPPGVQPPRQLQPVEPTGLSGPARSPAAVSSAAGLAGG